MRLKGIARSRVVPKGGRNSTSAGGVSVKPRFIAPRVLSSESLLLTQDCATMRRESVLKQPELSKTLETDATVPPLRVNFQNVDERAGSIVFAGPFEGDCRGEGEAQEG